MTIANIRTINYWSTTIEFVVQYADLIVVYFSRKHISFSFE